MNKEELTRHDEQRKKLWADVWVATANASNCMDVFTPTKWADEALKQFEKRFPPPINNTLNQTEN